MENRQKQAEKIYKATLEAVINAISGEDIDVDTAFDGIALVVAALMAAHKGEPVDDITIDSMAEGLRRRIIRAYNTIRYVEQQDIN